MKQKLKIVSPSNTRSRQEWAQKISAAWREQLPSIFETGNLLEAAKSELKHGEWLKMIKDELPFGARTAQKLMKIADNNNLRDATHASHLPCKWETLHELTKLTDEQFVVGINSGAINPKMERKDVALLRGIEPKERKKKQEYPSKLIDWRIDMHDRLAYAAFNLTAEERRDLFATVQHLVESLNREFDQREREEGTNAVRES